MVPLPPNLISQRATQPNSAQAKHQMRGNVGSGQKILAVAPKINCLVAERRKGCEAAEHADEHQSARFGGEDAARLGKMRKKSDRQTTDQIHRERAARK